MKAPSLNDSENYCEVPSGNFKFKVLHEGLSEWFKGSFEHIDTEKKELIQAFHMHIEWLWNIRNGVKSITDIDVTVNYEGQDIPSQVMDIYERFFKKDIITAPKRFGVLEL